MHSKIIRFCVFLFIYDDGDPTRASSKINCHSYIKSICCNIAITMEKTPLQVFGKHLKIFYYFGLSPRNGDVSSSTLPMWIFFTICFALDVCMAVVVNIPKLENADENPVENMMANLFVIADMCKVLSVFIQSAYKRDAIANILSLFHRVHENFVDLERWHIDYDHLRRSFSMKFKVAMFTFWISVVASLIHHIPTITHFLGSLILKSWNLGSTLFILHTVFYIDILAYDLLQLNTIIGRGVSLSGSHFTVVNGFYCDASHSWAKKRLKHYKILHFQLWKISQKINCTFGMSTVALTLQVFADLTYCLYWIMADAQSGYAVTKSSRKYFLLLL